MSDKLEIVKRFLSTVGSAIYYKPLMSVYNMYSEYAQRVNEFILDDSDVDFTIDEFKDALRQCNDDIAIVTASLDKNSANYKMYNVLSYHINANVLSRMQKFYEDENGNVEYVVNSNLIESTRANVLYSLEDAYEVLERALTDYASSTISLTSLNNVLRNIYSKRFSTAEDLDSVEKQALRLVLWAHNIYISDKDYSLYGESRQHVIK